ncbi:hypothetical protein O181_020526 [Austropuccinia psidii MF-1]|uniref:Uncharacterized protein n=1 Tax=Austropuccinia psidii MF-1 TaxID=1389203 RepID=A0A9Q3C978_9BASI|nr:hypothetical protein [Austropuccinia psidii MF-1]
MVAGHEKSLMSSKNVHCDTYDAEQESIFHGDCTNALKKFNVKNHNIVISGPEVAVVCSTCELAVNASAKVHGQTLAVPYAWVEEATKIGNDAEEQCHEGPRSVAFTDSRNSNNTITVFLRYAAPGSLC